MVLRDHDNTGRSELIAVETASFVHSDRLNQDSAQLCAAILVKTRFYEHEEKPALLRRPRGDESLHTHLRFYS